MGKRNIMFGARKGITPVIALVLLLMMTVAAAGMAYVWFMDVQEETQDTVKDSLSQRTDQMAAAVKIDATYEDGLVATSTDIIVRNIGSTTYTGMSTVLLGGDVCSAAVALGAPGTVTVVNCNLLPLSADVVIRVIPPQGSAVSVVCSIAGAGDDEYCVM